MPRKRKFKKNYEIVEEVFKGLHNQHERERKDMLKHMRKQRKRKYDI